MTPTNWIALAAILVTVFIAIWNAFRSQAKVEAQAQWAKIDAMDKEVQHIKTEVALLTQAMDMMPSGDELRDRLDALAKRMEGRLDALGQTLQNALLEFAKKARP